MTGRAVKEWIGKTPDTPVPPRVRLRVFDRHNGICHISDRKIQPGDKWEIEHIKPLHAGGENRESNLAPALEEPHKVKTKAEMALKKKVNRTRAKHVGAVRPRGGIANRGFDKTPKTQKINKSVVDAAALPPAGGLQARYQG